MLELFLSNDVISITSLRTMCSSSPISVYSFISSAVKINSCNALNERFRFFIPIANVKS